MKRYEVHVELDADDLSDLFDGGLVVLETEDGAVEVTVSINLNNNPEEN